MSNSTFVVWGGGGHGKVVADLVRACGHAVAGFIDADAAKIGRTVDPGGGTVVLREAEFLAGVGRDAGLPDCADALALAIGDNAARQRGLAILERCVVPPLVHPSAVVSRWAAVGRGTVVFAGAIVNSDARIGAAVIVNSAAVVEHDCIVGDGAHVSPGAVLAGGVRVGERTWIGAGATVIQGVAIGADVTVGAGAVVIRDVPDGLTVAGVPARSIRRTT
jgi:sugar O-acyltransferase (sialic acid O-acetyltransferase NeuD family)